ncbi:hypothetical protein ACFSM5_07840 [Lacibacterium aquatile]|uniref:Uncharacterized protein n=1 Tax=Lacibacterium aquatile TaxID=1168082 RepID=A0ABW5DQM3_9PROT
MRHEPPARLFISGRPLQINDQLHLRASIGLGRKKGAYRVDYWTARAQKNWPDMGPPPTGLRANVCSCPAVDTFIALIRSKKLTPRQETFESEEHAILMNVIHGCGMQTGPNGETIASITEEMTGSIMEGCPQDIHQAFWHTMNAAVATLIWLEFSGQITPVGKMESFERIRGAAFRMPFDLKKWVDENQA